MSPSVSWLERTTRIFRRPRAARQPAAATDPSPPDSVDVASDDSFPASDPPSFTPVRGFGRRRLLR